MRKYMDIPAFPIVRLCFGISMPKCGILAEGAIALPVTLSGGALFAS